MDPFLHARFAGIERVGRTLRVAGEACHRVGYLSASQFSREYGRFFGRAPGKDIARLREEGFAPSAGTLSRR